MMGSDEGKGQVHIALTILAGIGLGLFSHASSSLPGAWRWLGNFGALWLGVAFFTGRLQPKVRTGAITGAATLCLASFVHYVPHRMAREGMSWHAFRWPVVLWVVVGATVGAAFGALGAAHAERLKKVSIIAVGLLAASFAGEALVLLRIGHPRAVEVAVPIELAIAIALPLTLMKSWSERMWTYLTATILVPVTVLGLSAFMGVIHRVYPGI